MLDFSNFANDPLTAKITVPCKIYSNSAVITKINEAMEKIETFLHSINLPLGIPKFFRFSYILERKIGINLC